MSKKTQSLLRTPLKTQKRLTAKVAKVFRKVRKASKTNGVSIKSWGVNTKTTIFTILYGG